MRISCPNCDAQYEVDDAVIPEAGRDVQCSNCGQTWFQPGAPATTPPPATSAAPEPAPSDDHAEPQQDIAQDDHPAQAADAVQDDQTPQPDEAPEEPAPSPAPADAPEAEAASEPEPAAEEEPVAEPEAELVAEAPEAEEDDDAPEQSLRRRGLDAAVADVLREEAEREARAREAEAQGGTIESQPNLGLESQDAADGSELRERIARLRGVAPDAFGDGEAEPRRDLLPDVEEINSTLAGEAQPEGETQHTADETVSVQRERRNFGRGFGRILLVAAALVAVYNTAPDIAQRFPAAEPFMNAYVADGDAVRVGIYRAVSAATDGLNGLLNSQGDP